MANPYSSDDRNADNPFAYYETVELPAKPATTFTYSDTEPVPPKDADAIPFEPRTPFSMSLIGADGRVTLEVFADRCEFSGGGAFDFPLVASRSEAASMLTINARSTAVRLFHEQCGHLDFKVPDNPMLELQLARLETWCDGYDVDGTKEAVQKVTERMEFRVTRRVLGLMIGIAVMFTLPLCVMLFSWVANDSMNTHALVVLIPVGVFWLGSVSLTIGVAHGKIWALQTTTVYSIMLTMGTFMGIFLVPMIFIPGFILALFVTVRLTRTDSRYFPQLNEIESLAK